MPAGEVHLNLPVEVIADFLVDFGFDAPAPQERACSKPQPCQHCIGHFLQSLFVTRHAVIRH